LNLEDIQLAFRMISMGRPHQEAAQKLAEALAVLLASPEERLASMVVEEPKTPIESPQTANAPVTPDKPRRGRPPKPKVGTDGEDDGRGPVQVP
jgi:hypothetical protein